MLAANDDNSSIGFIYNVNKNKKMMNSIRRDDVYRRWEATNNEKHGTRGVYIMLRFISSEFSNKL